MRQTSTYKTVDELPNLLDKAKQPEFKSVDELPDLKKKVSGDGSKEPLDGGLSGTTSTTEPIPTIEMYQTPTGDLTEDPFNQVKKAKELLGKTKVVSKGGIGGMGMGTTGTEIVPDEEATKEANKIQEELKRTGYKEDFFAGISDLPEDVYNNPTTSKETLSVLYKNNPVKFTQLTNEAKNKYAIRDAAAKKAYDEAQGDDKQKTEYASRVGILKGNEYSGDEIAPPENMQQFYDIVRQKQQLIDQNIDSPEEKKKAQERLRQTYAQAINPTSLDFREEYQNSGLADKLDVTQYAGLKTLELFEPEKAKVLRSMVEANITPQWNVNVQVTPEEQVRSIVTDSAMAEKMGGTLSQLTVNKRIGKEEALRELSLLGATNEYDSIVSEQNDLKKRYQEAKTDEEKANIYAKMLLNEQRANDLQKTEAKNDERYPITAKLKMDNLVKEIVQDRGIGVGGWMYNKYAHGVGSGVDAVENLVTSIFGSEKEKTDLRMKRIGEGKQFEASIYLPESERSVNSPVIIQASDELKKKAKEILNGRSLSELSADEKDKLSQLVASNQDQIKTITNPEAGKSKNFWSKATGMTIAGFTSDMGAFLTKMGLMQGVGMGAKAAEATTLFMDGYEPAFNKKLSEGASVEAANEYGILHGAVLSLMSKFGSKYETIKNVVKGGSSPISKYIAGLSEESWNKLAAESKPFLSKVGAATKNVVKEQGKMVGTFGIAAPVASAVADNLFYDEGRSVKEISDEALMSAKEMAIGGIGFGLFGLARGVMKTKATPVEKAALFEMADFPELGKMRIDEAVKNREISKEEGERKKSIIDNVSRLVEQVPEVNDKGKPLNDQQRANYLFNLAVKESQKEKAKTLPEKQAEEAKQKALVADKENQIELEALTEKQLNDRKDKLEKAISKLDEKGKPELSDKEMADAKAELQAVENIIKSKGDTSKTEEKQKQQSEQVGSVGGDVDWSKDIENVDLSKVDWKNPTVEESIAGHENHIENNVKKGQQSLLPAIRELAKKYNLTKEQYLNVLPSIRQVLSNKEPNINSIENIIAREGKNNVKAEQPTVSESNPLRDVESTAKALDEVNKNNQSENHIVVQNIKDKIADLRDKDGNIPNDKMEEFKALRKALGALNEGIVQRTKSVIKTEGDNQYKFTDKDISEAYHKAKADGSNPELVKAVESLLSKEQTPPALESVESTAKKIVGESAFDKLTKEGYTIEKGKFDSDAYASFFGLHTGVQASEFEKAGLRLIKPSEKIKVYRGKGKNVAAGENEGVTWVAEDKKVAENYSGDGQVEEVEVSKPKNPFQNPTDTIHVKGSDVGNKLKGILNRLFRDGKVTKEQAIEASKAINDFVSAAGEESELHSTKTNKKGVSSKYVKALQALGFDGIVQKESYNSGSPFTATKTGNETNTYGIFKSESLLSKEQTPPALRDVESTAKALEEISTKKPTDIVSASKKIDKVEYVEENEAREIIESYTHYKSGNSKSPATRWAGWFQSVNAANKKFIVEDIQNDPKLRNAMLSLFYDVYKKEFDFNGTFNDFLNTEITLYRGVTLADKKGVGQEGFSAFSTTKNRVLAYADEQALGKGQVKEIKIRPIDTYGAVNYIGGGEVEVLVPTDFKKETLKDDFNRLVELNIGLFNDEQLKAIENFYESEDYISGIALAKSVISLKPKALSEAYHKAKADGSNPELVKAVEDLLGKPKTQTSEQPTKPVTKPIPEVTETTQQQGIKEAVPEGTTKTGRTEPERAAAVLEGGKGRNEPPPTEKVGNEEGGKLNDKGVLNHLVSAKNIPEESRKGFEEKGLKYNTSSQKEAEDVAKSVIDQYGIDDAVLLAEAQKFDGDVNSLIYAESLNRLAKLEEVAKTPQEKAELGKKFAEVGIKYDEAGRKGGRFSSAINYFYKKSPLGIQMIENAKRKQAFEEWAKPKDKSWKEFFDEMMKEPEFDEIVKEQVKEGMKKERAEARAARIKKVDEFFDKAKDEFKGGAAYSTIIPPKVITTALEGMRQAYHAGEKIAEIIEKAIDYISEQIGNNNWDKEKFRKEWSEKLKDKETKKPLTDEEIKAKILDKFRKKLKGLTDKEKEEVVRKSFQKIVESGGLDYADFKKIIADITGRGELTEAETARLKELVKETNLVDEAGERARVERTQEARKAYFDAQTKAAKASKELNELLYNRPNIIKRLTSIMQLNTLGIPALVNNPIYNIWNQTTLRLPVGIVKTIIDQAIKYGSGGKIAPETNILSKAAQAEFFSKLGLGTKESFQQFFTGLNRADYVAKEIQGQQIRPATAIRDLWAFFRGKKNLDTQQQVDKALQATVGIPAEIVARTLNLGDKPQRFAAEGAQAAAFAKALGLKDIDYDLFIDFPREEAYRAYKQKGLSDAEAGKKADYIKDIIIKEGQRSTFQQDNMLNDVINRAFGGEQSGLGSLAKSITISPYIKIPSNAYWSYYNLVNPEVAFLQSIIYGAKAAAKQYGGYKKFLGDKDNTSAAKDLNEAKYWFAHGAVGMATRAVVISLVGAGAVRPSNTAEDTKKEREGEQNYEQQGTINVSKLFAAAQGKNPDDIKNGLNVQMRWFGHWGTIADAIARKNEEMTPEQRKNQAEFWDAALGGLEIDALKDLNQGVFGNTSSLLTAIERKDFQNYGVNLINMFTNVVQPAALAQVEKAAMPYYTKQKADTFLGELNNTMLTRSKLYRDLTNQYPPSKIGIWGDKLEKKDNFGMRLFGISRSNPDNFAQPIYEDYKRTNNTKFLPPSVRPIIEKNGVEIKLPTQDAARLEELVGQQRKNLISPYINDMATFEGSNKVYSKLSDSEKEDKLRILYEEGYNNGKELFLKEHPEYNIPDKTRQEKIEDKKESRANKMFRKALQKR